MINPYYFFCDMETSGFSPYKNDTIDLAGIVANQNLEKIDFFHEQCRPHDRSRWSPGCENAHGISLDEAMNFQEPRRFLISFMKFLRPYLLVDRYGNYHPIKFICHAKNHFDFRFLSETFVKEGLKSSFEKVFNKNYYESTHDLLVPYKEVLGLDNLKLDTVSDHFKVDLDHHKADSDAYACFEIYKKVKNKIMARQGEMH